MKVNKGESLLMNSHLSHQIQQSVDVHVLLCALKATTVMVMSADPKKCRNLRIPSLSIYTTYHT